MILSVARGLAGGTDTSPARPIKKIEMLKKRFKRATSRPVHSKPARFHDDIFILAGKFHQVHQQFHIVFAVGTDLFLAALAPPLDNLEAIAGLLVPQRFPGQVIEFNAESEPALQVREQVKRFADKIAHRMVPAKYLEIEAVPVKRNDALKLAQFGGHFVALQKGYFKEEGIDAVFLSGGDNIDGLTLVESGQVDMADANGSDILTAVSKGIPLKSFGTIYQITPAGNITVLKSFGTSISTASGLDDGNQPLSLMQGNDGNLYFTNGVGVYGLTPAGNLLTIYTFPANGMLGIAPSGTGSSFAGCCDAEGHRFAGAVTRRPARAREDAR